MIFSFDANYKEIYLSGLNKNAINIYWFIVTGLLIGMAALPFLFFDVSVKSPGIIRPSQERTEIKSAVTGIIDTIHYSEGQMVPEGAVIITIKDNNTGSRKAQAGFEMAQRTQFVRDLQWLTAAASITGDTYSLLSSPLYKQQISRFLYQRAEHLTGLEKLKRELRNDSLLAAERIITINEYLNKKAEYEKMQAAYDAFGQEQLSIWQQDLVKYRLELSQLRAREKELLQEAGFYQVKAPVTGTLQNVHARYAGSLLQAGETIGNLSPETELIAECLVPTSDVGLLKMGQEVKFQIDAFDYNYFGIATGKLVSIDNDFTPTENQLVFKVRCSFDQKQLYLKNSFTGHLKKGMTVQARFMIARRSLWQLMFDKLDDWTNPSRS